MDYQNQCQELDTRIRSTQKIGPEDCYISDGIVDINAWRQQKFRPLFIGKEAYDYAERPLWNYTDWLKNSPQEAFSASRRTWGATAYISYALQNGMNAYSKLPRLSEDEQVDNALQTIAFINVGKLGGKNKTSWFRLNSLYQQNAHLLREQIEFYQPNIIIGWSTLDFFEKDEKFRSRFGYDPTKKMTLDRVDYLLADDKLFIDAYHPAYLGVPLDEYVNSIIAAVKKHKNEIDQSLPTL